MKKMIWAGLLSTVTALGAAVGAQAQTSVPFALDWKFEGPRAAYFAAIDNGHFAVAFNVVGPLGEATGVNLLDFHGVSFDFKSRVGDGH